MCVCGSSVSILKNFILTMSVEISEGRLRRMGNSKNLALLFFGILWLLLYLVTNYYDLPVCKTMHSNTSNTSSLILHNKEA